MQTIIKDYLQHLQFGQPQVHENMAVVPLLSLDVAVEDYILLDEGLNQGVIEISEVSKEGSVPELLLTNKSDKMLLALDGEELVGAKQNRILNASILIASATTLTINCSCVESGRWSGNSIDFSSENRMAYRKLRAKKAGHISLSTRQDGSFRSNQGEVWNEIHNRINRRKAVGLSTSSAMSSIYENEADKDAINAYVQSFRATDCQVGSLFFINGIVSGIECFGKADTLCKIYPKLRQSYVLDAIDDYDKNKVVDFANLEAQGNAFIHLILDATAEEYKSVGLGTDTRLSSSTVNGFALTLQAQLLHLSAFPLEANNRRNTTLLRSSMRRRRLH